MGQGQTLGQSLGRGGSQSLEKVTLFSSFFSIVAWTDLTMSWVCSMPMFHEAWIRRQGVMERKGKDWSWTNEKQGTWAPEDKACRRL